jgi:anti-sigma factor RsiW
VSAPQSDLPLAMRCEDIEVFVDAYLDGELQGSDSGAFEAHVGGCAACRALVDDHAAFKATLRAQLRPPQGTPPDLRAGVLAALDRADEAGEGPLGRVLPLHRRALPFVAVFAAAAAMTVFVSGVVQTRAGRAPLVEDAIRSHEKHLPVEVAGDPAAVSGWLAGKVPVAVRPPQLSRTRSGGGSGVSQASLVGARIGHLSSRDAAQLHYRVNGASVTVYVFDASNLAMTAPRRRLVDNRELFVDGARGYSVVFYRERGVGYAFTSDLSEDQLVELVSASLE